MHEVHATDVWDLYCIYVRQSAEKWPFAYSFEFVFVIKIHVKD